MITNKEFESLGFKAIKGNPLIKTYMIDGVHLDLPYHPGGRSHIIRLKYSPERNSIEIDEADYTAFSTIYSGYCRSFTELKDLLYNRLFGGDGQTKEQIKKQFKKNEAV